MFDSDSYITVFKIQINKCVLMPYFLSSEDQCKEAFMMFNGRWYAGRQMQCEFSPVTKWKTAICGKPFVLFFLSKNLLVDGLHSFFIYSNSRRLFQNSEIEDLVKNLIL